MTQDSVPSSVTNLTTASFINLCVTHSLVENKNDKNDCSRFCKDDKIFQMTKSSVKCKNGNTNINNPGTNDQL